MKDIRYNIKRFIQRIPCTGFIHLTRYEKLRELIERYNFESYAEIGVWRGWTTRYLLKNTSLKKVICIDPYEWDDTLEDEFSDYYSPDDFRNARASVKDIASNQKVTFYFSRSKDMIGEIEDRSMDLVFIDGNHSYKAVMEDILLWKPKVRIGGILAGHDYNLQNLHTVCRAVDEVLPKRKLYPKDSVWWIQIRE